MVKSSSGKNQSNKGVTGKKIGNGKSPAARPRSVALSLGVPINAVDLDAQLAAVSFDAINGAIDHKVAAQVISAASARVRLAVAAAKFGKGSNIKSTAAKRAESAGLLNS